MNNLTIAQFRVADHFKTTDRLEIVAYEAMMLANSYLPLDQLTRAEFSFLAGEVQVIANRLRWEIGDAWPLFVANAA